MDTKFTPGPWEVSGKVAKLGPDNYLTVIAPDRWVAHVLDGCEKSEEDARLIAAAPDLHDSIRDLLAYLDGDISGPAQRDGIIAEARAALAKVQP